MASGKGKDGAGEPEGDWRRSPSKMVPGKSMAPRCRVEHLFPEGFGVVMLHIVPGKSEAPRCRIEPSLSEGRHVMGLPQWLEQR